MGTLQDNQSLNAEYERNKKEREMKEEIERLNNIISKIEKAVEIAINEDNYDGGIYDIKDILGSDKE